MEAVLPQFVVDRAVVSDCLFALVDEIYIQHKQGNITAATPPIENPPTNTKI